MPGDRPRFPTRRSLGWTPVPRPAFPGHRAQPGNGSRESGTGWVGSSDDYRDSDTAAPRVGSRRLPSGSRPRDRGWRGGGGWRHWSGANDITGACACKSRQHRGLQLPRRGHRTPRGTSHPGGTGGTGGHRVVPGSPQRGEPVPAAAAVPGCGAAGTGTALAHAPVPPSAMPTAHHGTGNGRAAPLHTGAPTEPRVPRRGGGHNSGTLPREAPRLFWLFLLATPQVPGKSQRSHCGFSTWKDPPAPGLPRQRDPR